MALTVYSKPSCVQCTATYRALDAKGIEYTTWDGWLQLDEHEQALGASSHDAEGNPRERVKVVDREEMVRVSRQG